MNRHLRRAARAAVIVGCLAGPIATAHGAAWNPIAGSPFASGAGPTSVAYNPTGTVLASTNGGGASFSMFTAAASGALTPVVGSPFATDGTPRWVSWHPDGAVIAVTNFTGHTVKMFTVSPAGVPTLADTKPLGGDSVMSVFNPAGTLMATTDNSNNRVFMWTVAPSGVLTAVPGSPFATGTSNPSSAMFSPNGQLLAIGDNLSNVVKMYSVAGNGVITAVGAPVATPSSPVSVQWNPAATLLATANSSGSTSMYSATPSGALTLIATTPRAGAPRTVQFSADGKDLVTGLALTSTVAVDTVSGTGALTPHPGSPYPVGGTSVFSATFNPTAKFIATGNNTSANVSVLRRNDPPTATIVTPPDGADYFVGQAVTSDYSCSDTDGTVITCVGDVAVGAPIDTATVGEHAFTVTATDNDGGIGTATTTYKVHPIVGICRATALQVFGASAATSNPAENPCATDTQTASAVNIGLGSGVLGPLGRVTVGSATSHTIDAGVTKSAEATASPIIITLPGVTIRLDGVTAQASATLTSCSSAALAGSSQVGTLRVNGLPITLSGGPQSIPLVIGAIHVNQQAATSNAITQRAVFIDLPGTALDVVLGEVVAGVSCGPLP
jgi:6-phosphogluconolactonase